ncbi:HupE/UreJ family protein [Candidatus Leptofilum sp.]|uniref:HupE/UreJ family protein n=1 Tax=Candidatus Leptofilum sp. TaxID=3241576 RepID=UPI003B5BD144
MKKVRLLIIAGLCLWLMAMPTAVFAHDEGTVLRFGSFLAGFTHPVLGLDHLLAMLSVGIVSSQIGGRAIWVVPATFVGVMAIGGLLGLLDLGLTAVETGIAISVLLLGLAIAAGQRIPLVVALIAVALFATFHGYAHGAEMPDIAKPVRYALGFLLGTAVIHVAGVLLGDIPQHYKIGPTVLRLAGGGIAIVGILFLFGVL